MAVPKKPQSKDEERNQGAKNAGARNPALDEFVHKTWPKVKEDLEAGIKKARELIVQGEKEVVKLSDKGSKQFKIMTLTHKKDRHYHELGKLVSALPRQELLRSESVTQQLNEIEGIDREITAIQAQLGEKK